MLAIVPASASLRIGDSMPRIVLDELNGAQIAIPANFHGKVTVIHFWTSGCSSCREEMPALDRIYHKFNKRGLEVIAVNVGQSKAEVKKAVAGLGVSFPVLLDQQKKTIELYEVKGVPRTLILDRNGRISYKIIGNTPTEYLNKYIGSLLSQ
jgi:thiol-disulfide isomerase/thioredoxin